MYLCLHAMAICQPTCGNSSLALELVRACAPVVTTAAAAAGPLPPLRPAALTGAAATAALPPRPAGLDCCCTGVTSVAEQADRMMKVIGG